jgi:HEPN domain-containing protein
MKTSEANPSDWFFLANERLASADALLVARGACYSAVELLHESVERYLKGYLVERGWQLERIHDLNRLLDLATQHHPDFSRYQQLAQSLTEQFWAQHYPGDDLTEVGLDFPFLRAQAEELVALITSTPPP